MSEKPYPHLFSYNFGAYTHPTMEDILHNLVEYNYNGDAITSADY